MKKHHITLAGLALATFLLGFLLREFTDGSQRSADQKTRSTDKRDDHRLSALDSQRDDPDQTQLERDLAKIKISEGAEHWLRLAELLEHATLDDMPAIAATVVDYKAVQLVGRRWLELDASDLYRAGFVELDRMRAGEDERFDASYFLQFLGEEWAGHDLEGGIFALSQESRADPNGELYDLRGDFLKKVGEIDPRRGFKLAKQWQMHGPGSDSKALREWAATDPRGAVAAAFEHTRIAEDFHTPFVPDSFKLIAEVWADSDAEVALAHAAERSEVEGRLLRELVFTRWANQDTEAATEWLRLQDDPEIQKNHRPTLIKEWGKKDPRAALLWCQENIDRRQELHLARFPLFEGAASVDPALAAALVEEFVPKGMRSSFTTTIATEWFDSRDSGDEWKAPKAAVEWLLSVEDVPARARTLERIQFGWIRNDPDGLQAFLRDPRSSEMPSSSYEELVKSLAADDPVHTLEWTAELGERNAVEVSGMAFDTWLDRRSAEAADWFAKLPADDARRATFLQRILVHARDHPQNQSVITNLNPADIVRAKGELEKLGMSEENSQRLRGLLGE